MISHDSLALSFQIRNSSKLKRIMQTILSLGNALNQGTARGELTFVIMFDSIGRIPFNNNSGYLGNEL